MAKFKFLVEKVETQFAFITTEGETEQEAKLLALKKARQGIEAFALAEEIPTIWESADKAGYSFTLVAKT